MPRITRNRTGRISFSIPENQYIRSWNWSPTMTVELTLTKPDHTTETVTADPSGTFKLGKLEDGIYSFEIIGKRGAGFTHPKHVTGNINVSGNSLPNIDVTDTPVAAGPLPADTAEPAEAPAEPVEPATSPAADDSTTAIPLGNLHAIYVEEPHLATEDSSSNLAILIELDKEIIKIIQDIVTPANIDTRKISLQTHLQKLITRIEAEEISLEELKSVYEHHGINEIIKRIEATDVNLTKTYWEKIFPIQKIPATLKSNKPELAEAHKEYSASRKDLFEKTRSQRDKRKELKNKLKEFENKTLKENLETINELLNYSNEFKGKMNNTLQQLMAPNQTVDELNNIQANIGSSIENNHYDDKFDELEKFEEHMNKEVIPLNELSTEYEKLDSETVAAAENVRAAQLKYTEQLGTTTKEATTLQSNLAPITTTQSKPRGILAKLTERS